MTNQVKYYIAAIDGIFAAYSDADRDRLMQYEGAVLFGYHEYELAGIYRHETILKGEYLGEKS